MIATVNTLTRSGEPLGSPERVMSVHRLRPPTSDFAEPNGDLDH